MTEADRGVAQPAPSGDHGRGARPNDGGVPEDVRRVLEERARALARVDDAVATAALTEVMVFRLREEYYAVEVRYLRSVHRSRGITPVPCTPAHIAGILNVRGAVVTVIDLAIALGLSGATPEQAQVILVEVAPGAVGLLVDEVIEVRQLRADQLDRSFSGRDYARGIAAARLVVLDLPQLLASGRFDVLEEV